MPLYWLCYRHHTQITVVIEPGASLIHARMRAALHGLDEGEVTEGHELARKMRVPKGMMGRRLSREEAKRLFGQVQVRAASTFLWYYLDARHSGAQEQRPASFVTGALDNN
jgi:hypothetical protein